jgi:hypothetical protein
MKVMFVSSQVESLLSALFEKLDMARVVWKEG